MKGRSGVALTQFSSSSSNADSSGPTMSHSYCYMHSAQCEVHVQHVTQLAGVPCKCNTHMDLYMYGC